MTTPIWLDDRDARAVHDRSLILHGGAPGVRDAGLLDSALARPRQLAAYGGAVDIVDFAAAYAMPDTPRFCAQIAAEKRWQAASGGLKRLDIKT